MATFPKLKTNAIAQYPVARREQFQNQTVRFVDGSEQRYRDSAGARLEWEIQLGQLDEGELAAIEEFFLARQGAFGSFCFTDPWDGHVYDDCRDRKSTRLNSSHANISYAVFCLKKKKKETKHTRIHRINTHNPSAQTRPTS